MVMYRKPSVRSKNIEDRRGETRYAVQQKAVWAAEYRERRGWDQRLRQIEEQKRELEWRLNQGLRNMAKRRPR